MAAEQWQKRIEQRRPHDFRGQFIAQRRRCRQPIPQQREIARAAPACRKAPQRAADVRHRCQGRTDAVATERVIVKPADQREPLVDCQPIHQRCRDVCGEQAPAGGGLAAIDVGKQAVRRSTA
jgi:hypothetical protein